MSRWKDTPAELVIYAERLDGERVRFSELRAGEIVRFIGPSGDYIDPTNSEDIEAEIFFKVMEDPRQADGLETSQDYGWCVAVETIEDPREELS